jgi:hypothetical protein
MKKLLKAGVEAEVETKVETPKPGEFIQADTNVDAILDARGSRSMGTFSTMPQSPINSKKCA